jgi:hypothetical protein
VGAGVVGKNERADDELAGLDGLDLVADLDDHAAIFMAHVKGLGDGVRAAIGPEVGTADAGCRELDDGVGGLENRGFGDFLEANVAGAVENGCKH